MALYNSILAILNFIRKPLVLGLFLLIVSSGHAQCVLSANDDTEAEVLACLSACLCSEVEIPTTIIIDMAEAWDLTSAGAITFTIQGSGSLVFSGNGGSADELILDTGSSLIIEDPSNSDALNDTANGGNIRVTIGGVELKGNDFQDIIDNGGFDENWPGPVPVELVSFTGRLVQNGIKLSWQTASELNNDYFELQVSSDGETFMGIANIKGRGTSQEVSNYEWLHHSPYLGLNYYRLKQIDFNGDFEFSDIISVLNDAPPFLSFSAYPQPASDRLNFIFNVLDEENIVYLTIYNTRGEKVSSSSIDPLNREAQLDTSKLRSGMYVVRLEQAEHFYHGKIIIQK